MTATLRLLDPNPRGTDRPPVTQESRLTDLLEFVRAADENGVRVSMISPTVQRPSLQLHVVNKADMADLDYVDLVPSVEPIVALERWQMMCDILRILGINHSVTKGPNGLHTRHVSGVWGDWAVTCCWMWKPHGQTEV